MSDTSPRTVVVGGGVAGSSVALELARRDVAVTVLDRPAEGSATGAAAGMITAQYEAEARDPGYRLGAGSRDLYPGFVARVERLSGRSLDYRVDGMLVANRTPAETEGARASLEAQRTAGQRGEILEPGRAHELHGGAASDVDSYLWLPDEGRVDAQRLPEILHRAVVAAGAELRRRAPARGIHRRRGGGLAVRLDDGSSLEAEAVVVAAGAWSTELEGLPRRLPLFPVKGQMLRLEPGRDPPAPLLADHQGHYVVPREDGSVVVGSTMERAGWDASPDPETLDRLAAEAARLAPGLAAAGRREAWSGLRPVTGDGRPVLGPDPALPGLHYATGYGRNGILLAPLAGRVVAELVVDGTSSVEWEPFSPERLPEDGTADPGPSRS